MVQTIVDFLTVWKLDDFLGHCTVEHNKASVHCSLTFEIENAFSWLLTACTTGWTTPPLRISLVDPWRAPSLSPTQARRS